VWLHPLQSQTISLSLGGAESDESMHAAKMEPLWHSPLTGEKHFLQLDDMCGPMAYLKVALIWPLRQLNQFACARKEKKRNIITSLMAPTDKKIEMRVRFFIFLTNRMR
jgi:hypothetical protein